MKVRVYQTTDEDYEDIFDKERETKEIRIQLDNGCEILIAEHQFGKGLNEPQVQISFEHEHHLMNFATFIKKVFE